MASGIPVDGISPVVQRPQFIYPGFQFVARIDRLLDALAGCHSSGRANPNHRAPYMDGVPAVRGLNRRDTVFPEKLSHTGAHPTANII